MTYPDQNVLPGEGVDMAEGFQVMIRTLTGIQQAVSEQTQILQRTLDVQSRYALAGAGRGGAAAAQGQIYAAARLPQVRQSVLHEIARTGGMNPEHMTAGMTQITPVGALSSLQNLQTFAAQRLGQAIAGEPIFDQPGQRPGAGAPPPGTTISTPGGGTFCRIQHIRK